MRRLSLSLVLASVVAACGGSGMTPTPVPTGFPETWTGTVHISQLMGNSATVSVDGNVAWAREHDPDVAVLGNATSYTASGQLKVTYRVDSACSGQDEEQIMLGPNVTDDGRGFFVLNADGHYSGYLSVKLKIFDVSVTCSPGGSGQIGVTRQVNFDGLTGNQVNGHMQGVWVKVYPNGWSEEGAWDFTAVAWLLP